MSQRDAAISRNWRPGGGWTRPAPAAPPDEYCAADDLYRQGWLHSTSKIVTSLRDRLNTPARRELFAYLDEVRAWAEAGDEDAKPPRLPWGEDAQ